MVVTHKVKRFFFDRAEVLNRIGKAKVKVLSKAGAFIRTAARSSLRRRKKPSPPGQPPSVHSRDKTANLKNILFAYDPSADSVVVGPVKLNQANALWGGGGATTVPQLHEQGGTLAITEVFKFGRWQRMDGRSRRRNAGLPMRRRRARYAPRPFMAPAAARELPKFPSLWADSVRRTAA